MDNMKFPPSYLEIYVPPHQRNQPLIIKNIKNKRKLSNQVYEKEECKQDGRATTPTQRQQQTNMCPCPCSKPNIIGHYLKEGNEKKLAKYLHAACFPPVKSTWERAIENKKIATWPGLLTSLIQKKLPLCMPMVQGNLHKQ